jgi:acyl-lipid omega-6 desaturase (Delta-12 desaturase)
VWDGSAWVPIVLEGIAASAGWLPNLSTHLRASLSAIPDSSSGTFDVSDSSERRRALARYAQPDLRRGAWDLATSAVPYLGLLVIMYGLLSVSYVLVLVVSVPAAGFAVRTFIVFHDCAHGSFLRSKRANAWLGALTGVLVFQCFRAWRHDHAVHHASDASAGDLDRRGVGDVPTITVEEYRARSWRGRLGYRLFRNPLVMFGLGPIVAMLVSPRIVSRGARPRVRNAVLATDGVLIAVIGALCWLVGWRQYLEVQLPTVMLAGAAGVWLFYVQHQFEDVYWAAGEQWRYEEAALRGSSYLRLPRLLRFFSGNIGLHHVHHLNARIPNYNLQRAHDDNQVFRDVPVLTLADGLRATRLKLYAPDRGRLLTFAQARQTLEMRAGPGSPVAPEPGGPTPSRAVGPRQVLRRSL